MYRHKKKGGGAEGGSARFQHSARCASKWRRPNLHAGKPNHGKSYANDMQVSDLELLFLFFKGFG